MAFNGSGAFLPQDPPAYPAIPGEDIIADYFNAIIDDIISGFGNCITRDGQSPPTANLPMGNFKHTGAAPATAAGEYITYDQSPDLYFKLASKSANYTLVSADAGWMFLHPESDANDRTFTIPSNASVPFVSGDTGKATTVSFVNFSPNDLTLAINTDTLYFAADGTTGSRILAPKGVATAIKITATKWLINGTGLS